ncbi:glycosyltransferase [Qaidamihabitans albus]|uniref:glycosyltransferase n=1 Tax=Qaidamihabitans albus TaxID=2795733 RepID=UPI0018F1B40C|nr:glycosyltransferase [Qaidamihabitans albus]
MSGAPTVGAGPAQPSVLHVNDAAFTARRMIAEAGRRGYTWRYLPKAAPDQEWRGLTGRARRAVIGAAWVARLWLQARRHDIVHVHSASTLAHSRFGAPRFVVHCHGTDVRTAQYDPPRSAGIRAGLRDAEAVFYSTPDLAEHVLPHRADAVYLPVPIDVDDVEKWSPAPGRPQVVFASRWSPDKDSATQLALARDLVAAVGDRADVVGLAWGPQADEAAELGVRLVPRGDHAAYLRLLAGAHVVVGQAAGILAASELEALAAGSPLVVPVPLPLYSASPPPVLGGSVTEAADAVTALLDGSQPHDPDVARRWAREEHGVERAVDTVARVHRDVMAARR